VKAGVHRVIDAWPSYAPCLCKGWVGLSMVWRQCGMEAARMALTCVCIIKQRAWASSCVCLPSFSQSPLTALHEHSAAPHAAEPRA